MAPEILSLKDVTKTGKKQENRKWEQSKELERQLLIGVVFKLSFAPIFHFLVPCAHSLLPVPRFSNIYLKSIRTDLC